MQRRAAAVSVAVFLLIAAGSFAFIGAAQQPGIEVQQDRTLALQDTPEVGGIQYNVSSLSEGSATMEWTNESARYTATLGNDTNVSYQNESYHLTVEDATDPTAFTLREVQNVSTILANDPEVYNETYTSEGERYVRYRSDGSVQPLEEYLPEPRTERFAESEDYPYENQTATVDAVTNASVQLSWTAPRANSISISESANVTLGSNPETTYVAHFPDASTLVLSQDFAGYQASLDAQAYYQERVNGLWGVVVAAGTVAVLLTMFAYLPSRY
jgi:hypothetical protein